MAKRSILSLLGEHELSELKLKKNNRFPDLLAYGDLPIGKPFSMQLSKKLLEWLQAIPCFKEAKAIALGSWARDEISPFSDIDLLLLGPEKSCRTFVKALQETGAPFRCRMAESKIDWAQGVEEVDILALLNARALSPELQSQLDLQKNKILENTKLKKAILRFLIQERKKRNQRYDSITNYLEPNLKYQLGGMRDLNQALSLLHLFSDRFFDQNDLIEKFKNYNSYFLAIRNAIHLFGYNDVLLGQIQADIATYFGFSDKKEFMRELQEAQEFVSFHCNWVFSYSAFPNSKLKRYATQRKIKSLRESSSLLLKDPGIINQKKVRDYLGSNLYKPKTNKLEDRLKLFYRMLRRGVDEESIFAFFQSRVIYEILPDLKPLSGLVQLDQYHQYTADAHILKCLLNIVRVRDSKKHPFSKITENFKNSDWTMMFLLAFFHDIGKGKPEDHSIIGEKICKKRLTQIGLSKKIIDDLKWLVRNHLLLSQAAFRRNIDSTSTWKYLKDSGLTASRLKYLCVFTYIDIISTNPSAWSVWKEDLLLDLYHNLLSEKNERRLKLLEIVSKAGQPQEAVLSKLSDLFIKYMLQENLHSDLLKFVNHSLNEGFKIFPTKQKNSYWVRFYVSKDRTGLFADCVKKIYMTGASIRYAEVMSFSDFGVYDWFYVRTNKEKKVLDKILKLPTTPSKAYGQSHEKIKLVSKDLGEWVINFKSTKQKDMLLSASYLLLQRGLNIRWARIHTWGRQVDNIFGVEIRNSKQEQALLEIVKNS